LNRFNSLNFIRHRSWRVLVALGQINSNALRCLSHDLADGNGRNNTDAWSQNKHKSDHDTGEIGGKDSIHGHEKLTVGHLVD